jgi:hypothetical protein
MAHNRIRSLFVGIGRLREIAIPWPTSEVRAVPARVSTAGKPQPVSPQEAPRGQFPENLSPPVAADVESPFGLSKQWSNYSI